MQIKKNEAGKNTSLLVGAYQSIIDPLVGSWLTFFFNKLQFSLKLIVYFIVNSYKKKAENCVLIIHMSRTRRFFAQEMKFIFY